MSEEFDVLQLLGGDSDVLKELLKTSIDKLQSEIRDRQVKLNKLSNAYNILLEKSGEGIRLEAFKEYVSDNNSHPDQSIKKDVNHDGKELPKLNWKHEVLTSLKTLNILSLSDNIYDEISKRTVSLIGCTRKDVISKISNALTQLHKKGQVHKIKNRIGKGNFWGLSGWFDSDGYEPNDDHKIKLMNKYEINEVALFGPNHDTPLTPSLPNLPSLDSLSGDMNDGE